MADIISLQELTDAKLDAQSLEQFINGGVDEEVLTRLSQQYPTIKKLLLEFQKYNGRAYKTYAEMDADKATIPAKSKVTVTNDATESNNGDWQWDGAVFTKSAYDPLNQSKQYIEDKVVEYSLDNIKAFAEEAEYVSSIIDDSEYELNPVGIALRSANGFVIYALQNGKFTFNVQLDAESISTKILKVGGTTLNKSDLDFISLSSSEIDFQQISSDNLEYELTKIPSLVFQDKNGNIVFNADEHRAALIDIQNIKSKIIELQSAAKDIESIKTSTSSYVQADLVPFIENNEAKVYDPKLSKETTIDISASDLSNARILDSKTILFDSSNIEVPTYFVDKTSLKGHPLIPRPKIVGWGHSFMQAVTFLKKLETLTGLEAYNFGAAGTTSVSIAARQGGAKLKFLPVGGVIPASATAVELTPFVSLFIASTSEPALKVKYCGIDGQISLVSSKLYFTRDATGDEIAVSSAQEVFVYPYTTRSTNSHAAGEILNEHNECINLFWLGRNNIANTATILSNTQSMIEYLKTKVKRFVILPDFPTTDEITGTTGHSQVIALNNYFKTMYPEHYCEIDGVDLLQNFKNHLNPDNSTDVSSVANGSVPLTLVSDNLHPTETLKSGALHIGTEVNATFVYQFLQHKGWI